MDLAAMTEEQLLDALVDLELEDEIDQAAAPLAYARLWRPHCQRWLGLPPGQDERPEGCGQEMAPVQDQAGVFVCCTPGCAMEGVPEIRTSQRDAFRGLTAEGLIAALIGGANRAGKTEGVMQLAVAMAAGRSEPWVQAWLTANDIDPSLIPEGPGTVWVSALTFNDALEYHRPKLDSYLPQGTAKRNWTAENQAKAILPNGGCVVSKAEAQGRKKYQGSAVRLVVLDEEHAEEIYEECLRATAEDDGLVVLSMTPLMGITWPHRVFLREASPEHYTDTITGLDNPHVVSKALRDRFKHLPPEKRDARLLGKWATAKGIIYPSFSRAVHLVPARVLPPEWPRYRAIDFGIWFACLWAALDPKLDQLHVYRVLKTYDVKLSENARQINLLSQGERIAWTVADPADKDARRDLAMNHGIHTRPARKAIEPGFDAVAERLAVTEQGHPRLVFHEGVTGALVEEIEQYRRDEKGVVVKANDHLCDDLRYLVYQLRKDAGLGSS